VRTYIFYNYYETDSLNFGRYGTVKVDKEILKTTLKKHYSLLGILFGSVLVSISLGPYYNWDSLLEYEAASGVIKWGFPYISPGNLINQPPLGYYIDAFFFEIFGLSYETGVCVITLFGLGCVFLVYEIGKIFYGKRTGLVAAALFGLTPWHVVMSRVFLIDTQCLFFSLLCLLVGIWAIQKGSLKILFVSGILFGLSLLTKAFGVYILIPLSLIYIYWRPKDLERVVEGIVLFFLPAFILHYLWYEIISGQGVFIIFHHSDFAHYFPEEIVPSCFFILHYFIENVGAFFLGACILSLLLSLSQRKLFAKVLFSDLVCLVTIICIAGLNTFLVLGRSLWVPYVNPIKYAYQSLPSFCWLAASLTGKCCLLPSRENFKGKQHRLIFSIAVIGLFLLMASMVMNMKILNIFSGWGYFLFKVEGEVGYSFEKLSPIIGANYTGVIQGLAFVSIVLSLFWFNLDKLKSLCARLTA